MQPVHPDSDTGIYFGRLNKKLRTNLPDSVPERVVVEYRNLLPLQRRLVKQIQRECGLKNKREDERMRQDMKNILISEDDEMVLKSKHPSLLSATQKDWRFAPDTHEARANSNLALDDKINRDLCALEGRSFLDAISALRGNSGDTTSSICDDSLDGLESCSSSMTGITAVKGGQYLELDDCLDNREDYEYQSKLGEFDSAMEKSFKSQEDLQQWDRKMGLRRCHSKTMTDTTLSREKLREHYYR